MTKYYLINVVGCTDPEIVAGPFAGQTPTDEWGLDFEAKAKEIHADRDEFREEYDLLMWASVSADGELEVGSFSQPFFEDDEEG